MTSVFPARRSGRIPAADLAAHDAALVEASGRLFREHGYAGVSIDMIAREASVSPKTIYARYSGKLGLFQAVVEAMTSPPVGVWDALDVDSEPGVALRDAADRFLAVVLSPEVIAVERVIIAEATRLPELAQTFYERGPRRGLSRLAAYFSGLSTRGVLHIVDPDRAAEAFIGLIEGEIVRRALFLGQMPTPEARLSWVGYATQSFLRAHAGQGD